MTKIELHAEIDREYTELLEVFEGSFGDWTARDIHKLWSEEKEYADRTGKRLLEWTRQEAIQVDAQQNM